MTMQSTERERVYRARALYSPPGGEDYIVTDVLQGRREWAESDRASHEAGGAAETWIEVATWSRESAHALDEPMFEAPKLDESLRRGYMGRVRSRKEPAAEPAPVSPEPGEGLVELLTSDEMVEVIARTIRESEEPFGAIPWDRTTQQDRQARLWDASKVARAVAARLSSREGGKDG